MENGSSHIPAMRYASISALGLFLLSGLLVFTIGAFVQIRVDLAWGLIITELLLIALPAVVFIVLAMGPKPSPSGETLRFIY